MIAIRSDWVQPVPAPGTSAGEGEDESRCRQLSAPVLHHRRHRVAHLHVSSQSVAPAYLNRVKESHRAPCTTSSLIASVLNIGRWRCIAEKELAIFTNEPDVTSMRLIHIGA
eukprot:scaffold10339_cov41-Cyclotella_meneghiniana.AAC.8